MDNFAKRPSKLTRRLLWTTSSLALGLAVVLAGAKFFYSQYITEVDKRIVVEVTNALAVELQRLPEDDDIVQNYGKFIELTDARWNRRSDWEQVMKWIEWSATAHFEKAKARIELTIYKGKALTIRKLEMKPSGKWRRDHPELAGELVLIDGELWHVNDQEIKVKGRCRIHGSATHPDLLDAFEMHSGEVDPDFESTRK